MALTGLQLITNSMYLLTKLKAGGVPSSDQQTAFLPMLNSLMESFQSQNLLGSAKTTSVTGKSFTTGVSSAGVWTETNIGGTTTTVNTPVSVATFATIGTSNTYPVGWDRLIEYNLAVDIAGAQGAVIAEHILVIAAEERQKFAAPPLRVVKASE